MSEFRIDYTVLRRRPGEADFTEVGFGSSGSWSTPDAAVHAVSSEVQNRQWETADGMPEPEEVDRA